MINFVSGPLSAGMSFDDEEWPDEWEPEEGEEEEGGEDD